MWVISGWFRKKLKIFEKLSGFYVSATIYLRHDLIKTNIQNYFKHYNRQFIALIPFFIFLNLVRAQHDLSTYMTMKTYFQKC